MKSLFQNPFTPTPENNHGHVLGPALAISILLYVLLDGSISASDCCSDWRAARPGVARC
jgi:hypothetical protein